LFDFIHILAVSGLDTVPVLVGARAVSENRVEISNHHFANFLVPYGITAAAHSSSLAQLQSQHGSGRAKFGANTKQRVLNFEHRKPVETKT